MTPGGPVRGGTPLAIHSFAELLLSPILRLATQGTEHLVEWHGQTARASEERSLE
jgi:hypothetical protein